MSTNLGVPYWIEPTGLRSRSMVEYRTAKRIQEQYTAFMEGFNELIPQELVNVFDERELELLIGGISESTFPPSIPPR